MTIRYCDADLRSGDNDGTSWANAYQTLQAAADNAVAGDTVYCQGTDSIAAAIDFDTNSGTLDDGYIKFIGVKDGTTNAPPQASDYDSGNGDSGYFIIDGQDNAINGIYANTVKYIWLENIKIHSCDGKAGITGTNSPSNWLFNNVWCHDNAACGISDGGQFRYAIYHRCRFTSNGTDGLYYPAQASMIANCEFIGNGDYGLELGGQFTVAANCIFHGNTTGAVYGYGSILLTNCVLDANGDGVNCIVGNISMIGCRVTNHNGVGKYGIKNNNNARVKLLACYLGNNSTDIYGSKYDVLNIDGVSLLTTGGSDTNHGYTDQTADDFNLRSDATYRSQAIPLD